MNQKATKTKTTGLPWRDFAAPVKPWTPEEAEGLRKFLRSDVGLRLGVMLRVLIDGERSAAIRAVEAGPSQWRCGHAAGIEAAVAAIDTLAQFIGDGPVDDADDRPADNLTWLHGIDPIARPNPDGKPGGSGAGLPG
jgi:hypothetical protein